MTDQDGIDGSVGSSTSGRGAVKWLLRLVLGVVVLYLAAANILLGTGLLNSLINRRPEKTFISIGSGWTLFPGRVHVKDFLVRGQTKKMQWQLTLGEGSFQIGLLGLIGKRVAISGGSGRDFDFRSRHRLAKGETQSAEQARVQPEIDGFSNPPDPSPEDLYPPRKPGHNHWRIDIDSISLDGKAGLWIGPFQVRGSGTVEGGPVVQIGGDLAVPKATVALEDVEILLDGEPLANSLDLDVEASLAPFKVKENKGTGVFKFMSGEIKMHGGSIELSSFDRFLPKASGLELTSGDGTLELNLTIPTPGKAHGTAAVSAKDARIKLRGGEVEGDVTLAATLDQGDLAEGTFDLSATRLKLDGVTLPGAPPTHHEARAEKQEAKRDAKDDREAEKVQRLEEKANQEREKGHEKRAEHAEDKVAREQRKLGEEEAESAPEPGDAKGDESGPWWAEIDLPTGTIDLGQPTTVDAGLTLKMKDVTPLLRIFEEAKAKGGKTPMWMKLVPDIRNIVGVATFDLGKEGIVLDDLDLKAEHLEVKTRLKLSDHHLQDVLYLHYKELSAGLELDDGKMHLHLLKAREWYEAQPELEPGKPPPFPAAGEE